jgi:hypothetical protein
MRKNKIGLMKDTLDGFFANIELINIRPRLTGLLAHFDPNYELSKLNVASAAGVCRDCTKQYKRTESAFGSSVAEPFICGFGEPFEIRQNLFFHLPASILSYFELSSRIQPCLFQPFIVSYCY